MTRASSTLSLSCFALALLGMAACASSDHAAPGPASQAASADEPNPRAPQPANNPRADPFAEAFVTAHNHHRAHVSPPANPPLPPVRWDPELAKVAQAWAERCVFEHSGNRYGENLSARTNMAPPETIVTAWADEAKDYNYARNRCAPGAVCGHYTQVVWRNSTTIGCGVAQCGAKPGGPFGAREWVMWVCNYSPPGNFKGEKPY